MDRHVDGLSWGLCVATYNRVDVLCRCVELALAQTVPPAEIVIVDAGDDWQANRQRMETLLTGGVSPRLAYLQAERRSAAAQRNQAIRASRADIVFLIDDDSLMAPDCAAEILSLYAADREGILVAIGTCDLEAAPQVAPEAAIRGAAPQVAAKEQSGRDIVNRLSDYRLARFVFDHVLMIPMSQRFVRYDRPALRWPGGRAFAAPEDCVRVEFIGGYSLTARREAMLKEPFDDGLVGGSYYEDLDACYRLGRHGALIRAFNAGLFHAEAASGRSRRKTVAMFQVLNMAYFLRRHTTRPGLDFSRYLLWYTRMLVANLIKELLRRRWSLPEVRGLLVALPYLPRIFARSPADIVDWYRDLQVEIMNRGTR